MNLLLVNGENNPITIGRVIVEDGIIHINPVPLEFVKEHFGENEAKDVVEFSKFLYSRTNTNTLTIDFNEFYKFLQKFNSPEYTVLDSLFDLIEVFSQYKTYPQSIFAQLLSEIGIDSDKLIHKLKDAMKYVIQYYERILIATLDENPKGERQLNSLFYIGISKNENLIHKQLKTVGYKSIFKNTKTTAAIEQLEKKVTKKTDMEFPLIAIIKLKIITEIFSIQNLQSIAEMSKFKQSLPSLEKLAEIFTELSNNEIPSDHRQKEEKENPTTLLEDIPAINRFLTKGITIKMREDKTSILKGDSRSDNGHLGLDLEQLQKFIKTKFPEILLD
jgi:hypothetical protein